MRSLGIIVYPDGSQAEIVEHETGAPIWESWIDIVRLKKPRRLTFAPFYLLVSVLLLLVGCVHLPVVGAKAYCLNDYRAQTRYCEYDSYKACKADLRDGSMCSKR